ncbi:MAG: metallophosphoesterase [Candidatus Heimdallarchaeota archaeon]
MEFHYQNFSTLLFKQKPLRCLKPVLGEAALEFNSQLGSILIVADLHIGFEGNSTKSNKDSILSQQVLLELLNLVKRTIPDILLICGDIKDEVIAPSSIISTMLWHSFKELMDYCEKIWILRGNHDGALEKYLPNEIRMFPGNDVLIQTKNGTIGFCHGHASFSSRLTSANILIMGHSHPSIHLRDRFSKYILRTWIRAHTSSFNPVQKQNNHFSAQDQHISSKRKEIIVLPPFNQYLGGFPLNEGGFVPGFVAERLIQPENATIYLLDGSFLGSVSFCTNLLL